MPRANRHHIPGQIWHITHSCHQREFLLRFARDRKCWVQWLFEAQKRYGLCILNYMVTSHHIHLLVVDGESDAISRSIQLIAGRSAQEFNRRKGRKGAYWDWVEQAVQGNVLKRETKWSEGVAVRDAGFVERLQQQLGRQVAGSDFTGQAANAPPCSRLRMETRPDHGQNSCGNTTGSIPHFP